MPTADNTSASLVFLVELFPYDPAQMKIAPQYLASDVFTTDAGDQPANQVYDNVIIAPYGQRNSLFTPGKVAGNSDAGRGSIILANPADIAPETSLAYGRYDHWAELCWSGRRVRVLIGAQGAPYVAFTPVIDGVISNQPQIEHDQIHIPVANALDRLNRTLQPRTYSGTGGTEGNANLAGRCKPRAFGVCRQVPAPLVKPDILLYQLHDGPISKLLAAYERGALIDKSSYEDYPDAQNLMESSIPLGSYATCLAQGLVRLGSQPTGPVTFDFIGDCTGGVSAVSAAAITERIMTSCFNFLPGKDYDPLSIAALATLQPAHVGWWSGIEETNALDVLDKILGGIGAWYSTRRNGSIVVGRLDSPCLNGPNDPNCALVISPDDIVENGLKFVASGDPPSMVTVTYNRYWLTQTTGYATSLTSHQIAELASKTRSVSRSNSQISLRFPNSQPIIVHTLLDQASDAENEAQRQLTLIGTQRRLLTVKTFSDPFKIDLGVLVWLVHPRYGLDNGQAFIVLGAEENGTEETVTLTLWG